LERKLKRKKETQLRKDSEKEVKGIVNQLSSLPEQCTQCNASFDLQRDSDSWIVECDASNFSLLCPDCGKNSTGKN
jgi:hypothetical protein